MLKMYQVNKINEEQIDSSTKRKRFNACEDPFEDLVNYMQKFNEKN